MDGCIINPVVLAEYLLIVTNERLVIDCK